MSNGLDETVQEGSTSSYNKCTTIRPSSGRKKEEKSKSSVKKKIQINIFQKRNREKTVTTKNTFFFLN